MALNLIDYLSQSVEIYHFVENLWPCSQYSKLEDYNCNFIVDYNRLEFSTMTIIKLFLNQSIASFIK